MKINDFINILNDFDLITKDNDINKLILAEEYIIKKMFDKNLKTEFIFFANKIIKHNIKLPKNKDNVKLKKMLLNEFNGIKHNDFNKLPLKINIGFMIFIADILSGNFNKGKINLLERIVDINSNNFVNNNEQLNLFFQIIKEIFTLNEIIEILKNNVFKGKFWNKDILTKKANFLWVFPNFWVIFGQEAQFKRLYESWLKIFYKAIQKNDVELVFFMMLPLTHIWTNLSTTQKEYRKFNNEVNRPFAEYIIEKVIPQYGIEPGKNIKEKNQSEKIAFVYDRIIKNSPTNLLYILLESLVHQNPENEYHVYDLSIIEKSSSDNEFIKIFEDLGVKYINNHDLINDADKIHYYSHFDKCMALRKKIIEDGIDVLILGNNWANTIFLYATRTAPKQIYWCHGAFEFDVPGIDERITHIGLNLNESKYEFSHFTLSEFNSNRKHIFTEEERNEINSYKQKYKDHIIFGNIGRIVKLESEIFIDAVAEVLKKYKNSVFLACGGDKTENLENLLIKYDINDRFIFPGFVKSPVYSQIIDIFLDTYPLVSGNAIQEYTLSKKRPLYVVNNSIIDKNITDEEFKNYFIRTAEYEADFLFFDNKKIREIRNDILKKFPNKKIVALFINSSPERIMKYFNNIRNLNQYVFLLNTKENTEYFKQKNINHIVIDGLRINPCLRISDLFIYDNPFFSKKVHIKYFINRMCLIKGFYNSVNINSSFTENILNESDKIIKNVFKCDNQNSLNKYNIFRIAFNDVLSSELSAHLIDLYENKKYNELSEFEIKLLISNEKLRKRLFYFQKRYCLIKFINLKTNYFYYINRNFVKKKLNEIKIGL